MNHEDWIPVIGLEIHVELNTQSKLFSSAPNRFGAEPNTHVSPVCTGQPGSLPVLNIAAVRKGIAFGCAIGGRVAQYTRFDRKSYFYPDSPRNFQITQYLHPLVIGGTISADVHGTEKTFEVDRAHLEDDAGMLKHFPHFTGIDDNRAGVPLIEIVSKPCIHSAEEAVAYAQMVRLIMRYIDASDCNMEEGSLRMDVNISVRHKNDPSLRNKVEIKNMNSFSFMATAIQAEVKRQIAAYEAHPDEDPKKVITQSTLRFDPEKKHSVLMRSKETAEDYRYFIEPDLPPLIIEDPFIEEIRSLLPELPHSRRKRYLQLGLSMEAATILIQDKDLSEYFDAAYLHCSNAKSLSNWITVEFAGRLEHPLHKSALAPRHIGELIACIDQGVVTGKIAKQVADQMILNPLLSPQEIIKQHPEFQPMENLSELPTIVNHIVEKNPSSVQDVVRGNQRAFGFLVGEVMKATQGKAPPKLVHQLLQEALSKLQ